MVNVYQGLNATLENKLLIFSVTELDYVPNINEIFEINGKEFIVVSIKHAIDVATLKQDLNIYVVTQEDFVIHVSNHNEQEASYYDDEVDY